MPGRARLVIAVLVLGFVASFPLVLVAAWREIQLGTGGAVTTGVVTAKDVNTAARNPDFCVLVYAFVDPGSGRTIRSSDGRNCSDWPTFADIGVGDRLQIRYLRDDPDVNRLEARPIRWDELAFTALWVGLGLGLLAYGVLSLRRRRRVGATAGAHGSGGDAGADPLLPTAIEQIAGLDRVSVADLSERLKVTYGRGQRIFDELDARGYLGPFDATNSREIRRPSPRPGP